MFQGLTEKLTAAFKSFRGKGKITEKDVKAGMRESKHVLLLRQASNTLRKTT